MSTIKDIAMITGLSIGTVSNVINNVPTVSEKNRKKVINAIKEIGYKPNSIARSLSKKKTNNIGFILPDIANPFFSEMLRGSQDTLSKEGYNVFLYNSDNDSKKEEEYLENFLSMWVAGIIITPSHIRQGEKELIESITIPVVITDREIPNVKRDVVIVDNMHGAYDITKFLISKGHKNIVILAGPAYVITALKRFEGWKKAMKEINNYSDDLIIWNSFSMEAGYKKTKELIENIDIKIDAIFAADIVAIGAMSFLEEKGYKIPQDISIAGFDDIYLSRFVKPSLTTIRQPIYNIGRIASEILIERMTKGNKSDYKRVVVKGELVIRDSVATRN